MYYQNKILKNTRYNQKQIKKITFFKKILNTMYHNCMLFTLQLSMQKKKKVNKNYLQTYLISLGWFEKRKK